MKKITIFGKTYNTTDLLIILVYLSFLVVLAILIWKLISPILAVLTSILIAYLLDLRKLIGRK